MKTNPPMTFLAAFSKFESARDNLVAHRNAHKRVFDTDDLLSTAYNEALVDVKKLYKEHASSIGEKYGEFKATYQTLIDIDLFSRMMGKKADRYVALVPKLDRAKYNAGVKSGEVSTDVVAAVETQALHSIRGPGEA